MENALIDAHAVSDKHLVIGKTAARRYVAVGVRELLLELVQRGPMQGRVNLRRLVVRLQFQRAGREHINFFRERVVAVQLAGGVGNGEVGRHELTNRYDALEIVGRERVVRRGSHGREPRPLCSKLRHIDLPPHRFLLLRNRSYTPAAASTAESAFFSFAVLMNGRPGCPVFPNSFTKATSATRREFPSRRVPCG